MFLFKKKKIILDCFTYDKAIYEHYKITKSTNFYPDWWKNMPKDFESNGFLMQTFKKCTGLIDTFKTGFMIPMWTDFAISTEKGIIKWLPADKKTNAHYHDSRQYKDYANDETHANLKLESPWHLKTKELIPFYFKKPFYNYKPFDNFTILEGVMDFKYNTTTHINLFVDISKKDHFVIKQSDPIVHLIPLTENEVVLKHHLISKEDYNVMNLDNVFTNRYNSFKKIQDKKCPFHFEKI